MIPAHFQSIKALLLCQEQQHAHSTAHIEPAAHPDLTPTHLHQVESILQRQGQHAHSTAHTVAAPHPVPEAEGVLGVDAKLLHQLEVRGYCHHVLCNSVGACVYQSRA
eukprot:809104-Pelagomonas_calceolata.AAC.1